MASLTSPVDGIPAGQLGWLHDLRNVADGTVAGAVTLAQAAGMAGILVKYADGGSVVSPGGQPWQQDYRNLAAACAAAGLACIPWIYVYPGDEQKGVPALVVQAQQDWLAAGLPGTPLVVLDAEIEFDNDPNAAADAQTLLAAIQAAGGRVAYTSWGWADQHPAFPWTQFQAVCVAFIPQIYPGGLQAGVSSDVYWNRAYGGPSFGGPNPGSGPAGFAALSPQIPVQPAFDFGGNTNHLAALARNWGAPAISLWVMDGMDAVLAQALAGSVYAEAVRPKAPPPAP